MSRYELSGSPSYVPEWAEVEAVRELFQNAIDSDGEMHWDYTDEVLTVSNVGVGLDKNTLLFGSTSKKGDAGSIGHFGEGYKLAFLVLARMGYKVQVYNYAKKELWEPKIIKSKRYDGDLLVVDVTKRSTKGEGLTFHISGLGQEIFDMVSKKNLHIQPVSEILDTTYGRILRDKAYKGQIFIKGLYVCIMPSLKFGYDILPQYLETNRDRNLASDFNIKWATSQMWIASKETMLVSQMVKDEYPDIAYVSSFGAPDLSKTMQAEFTAMHGSYAVPVADQKEYDLIRTTYKRLKPVFVKPLEKNIISCGGHYSNLTANATKRVERREPKDVMAEFFEKHRRDMKEGTRNKFKALLELSKDWSLGESKSSPF